MKFIQNNNLDSYQLFFCERILELIHKDSIDSHRVHLMNTKLIIEELVHLCEGWVTGKVHDFKTVQSCLDETVNLLNKDEVFVYDTMSKKFVEEFLKNAIKDKTNDKDMPPLVKNLTKIKKITHVILLENTSYGQKLLEKINYYIVNPITDPKKKAEKQDPYLTLVKIDELTSLLVTELIGKGFHKSYLSKFFNTVLSKKGILFSDINNEISYLITRKAKSYQVWFKFHASEDICKSLNSFSSFEVVEAIKLTPPTNEAAKKETC